MESILIIDDDITLCETLSYELQDVGYDVSFVTGVDDAVKFLTDPAKNADLLLLDLKMPGKNGYNLMQELKSKNIKKKVIVLTAFADVSSAMISLKLGANEFLSKPYDLDELLIAIRKVLQE